MQELIASFTSHLNQALKIGSNCSFKLSKKPIKFGSIRLLFSNQFIERNFLFKAIKKKYVTPTAAK